jgi:hypothetical protein
MRVALTEEGRRQRRFWSRSNEGGGPPIASGGQEVMESRGGRGILDRWVFTQRGEEQSVELGRHSVARAARWRRKERGSGRGSRLTRGAKERAGDIRSARAAEPGRGSAGQVRRAGVRYGERRSAHGPWWSAGPVSFGLAQRTVTSLIYLKIFKWLEWN